MAAAKKEQPFQVPDPSTLSDQLNAALAEKAQLDEQHAELKKREAHLAEKLRGFQAGTYQPGGSAREQAHALENLRQQLGEVRHELVIVERAREEARLAFQTHIGAASREACEKTRPEWEKRIRACVLPLFEFIEAHVALQELKGQLQAKEIRWLSFLPNVQFNGVIDALHRDELRELVANDIVSRDELPQVVRDRFDI